MPRLNPRQWQSARAYFEAGASQTATAEKYGISRAGVQKRITAEGWTQDLEEMIRRKVAEKSGGLVAGGDPQKTAQAVDAEAERRLAISKRHEQLVAQATALQQQALASVKGADGKTVFVPDFEVQKSAKINSETIQILIGLERKIHRLEDVPAGGDVTRTIFYLPDNGRGIPA